MSSVIAARRRSQAGSAERPQRLRPRVGLRPGRRLFPHAVRAKIPPAFAASARRSTPAAQRDCHDLPDTGAVMPNIEGQSDFDVHWPWLKDARWLRG